MLFRNATTTFTVLFMLLTPMQGADSGITHEQADQIINELREIHKLLQNRPVQEAVNKPEPPVRLSLDIGDAHVLGNKEAPLTIMEFTDFQCPFCQRFHLTAFTLLKRDYIDTGKVRFVGRDFPLSEIHPHATRAAIAVRCADDQGKYWELRDKLQRNASALEVSNLLDYAAELKMDAKAFGSCVETEKYKKDVERDVIEASTAGIGATPSFVIGKSTATGVDGELFAGAISYELLSGKLKALLTAP